MWWQYLLLIAIIIYCFYRWNVRQKQIKVLLADVQQFLVHRDGIFAEVHASCAQLPNEIRKSISRFCLKDLIEALRNRRISALSTLQTYQTNALEAHRKTNCLVTFIKEAEEWAKELDRKANDPNYVFPPLFGVPFSIKECISVKGYPKTNGYSHQLRNIRTEDAPIVRQIKELGGVPFAISTVPQGLLSFSCVSAIHGCTSNAYMPERTSGGSSGGEGALIACGGSPIGIGSDVGGSIRYPCHFNGIAGIKTSHMRFAQEPKGGSVPGRPLIDATIGPMAMRIDDVITFLRIIWSDNWISRHDPYVPPVTWNQQQFSDQKPLRIGYYIDDGWFKPTPALQTAVLKAVNHLEACGHTMIKFDPPNLREAFLLYIAGVTVDGGKFLLEKFNKDLSCDENREFLWFLRIPLTLKRMLGYIFKCIDRRLSQFLLALPTNTSELRAAYEKIYEYRFQFVKSMQKLQIDVILCPIQVMPAVEHHIPAKLLASTSYCTIFNLLDFAAGTIKMMNITEKEENELRDYPESDRWYRIAKEATKESIGLPVGVQVAAPPYHEETVLRVLQELENKL